MWYPTADGGLNGQGIVWEPWKGLNYSLKSTIMMVGRDETP